MTKIVMFFGQILRRFRNHFEMLLVTAEVTYEDDINFSYHSVWVSSSSRS